jgi:hypothetical protein
MQFTKQENDLMLFEFNLKPNLTTNEFFYKPPHLNQDLHH